MRYRIRHWFARFLCARGWHRYERNGSWSRCVRVHGFSSSPERHLCYVKGVRVAYDAGKGRMWLR